MANNPFAPGLLHRLECPVRKVVVLRASRLGDFICATPALRALRLALPKAEITIITLPLLRDLAIRLPSLDRYEAFPGFPGIAEQLFEPRRTLRFLERMQAERFDLAIQLQESGLHSNPFVLMLGARYTAGFVRDSTWASRLDAALPIPLEGHEARRLLALTTFIGASARGEETEFPLWQQDCQAADELLQNARPPLIGLHPGARDSSRQWPPEHFVNTGIELRRRYGGTIVLLGGAEELMLAKRVADGIGQPCLNLAGQTPLATLGAVIARLTVLVGNNSGPVHIAYTMEIPAITITGQEDLHRYAPLQEGPFRMVLSQGTMHPLLLKQQSTDSLCGRLEQVTPRQVVGAVEEVWPTGEVVEDPRARVLVLREEEQEI